MIYTNPNYYIFQSIKSVFKSLLNTDNQTFIKDVVLRRSEQMSNKSDSPHAYPYLSVDFVRTNRNILSDKVDSVIIEFELYLHTLELNYNKEEMFELVWSVVKAINYAKIPINETEYVQINVVSEDSFEKQEMEVVYKISCSTSSFKQIFNFNNYVDVNYLLRMTTFSNEQIMPIDKGDNGTSWFDLNGTNCVIFD